MGTQQVDSKVYRFIILILLSTFLLSCSTTASKISKTSVQPGEVIQQYLMNNNMAETDLVTALKKIPNKNKARKLATDNPHIISELYSADILKVVIDGGLNTSTLATELKSLSDTDKAVDVLVLLFPIDAYRLLGYSKENNVIESSTMLAIAAKNKLDPTILLAATASGLDNSITPLIHSAGIVIYGQDEDSTSDVRYRAVNSNTWLPALELAWEPIYGALSGSIVHLQPETDYEVEVLITDYEGTTELYSFEFETRPNSPPIDPDKIYYLSEIYSGGQLDLEALNIQGSENGYAKIIGDGQVIEASSDFLSAVNIGSQAYIMLENFTIKGGERYGIFAKNTHNIWIKGCDISEYGRIATVYKNNKGYSSEISNSPINYDSGIYLEKTGVSVIEDCEIHSPNHSANHWGYGHPNGPNALQVYAYHPDEKYRGQMIVRNNRFYGTDTHRFNDVIEGRKNFWRNGGFVRDSAIYGNYLAYANDDLIEIDGGQRNVLVYENEITQGYAGISIAPNRLGPSYVFHNHIHDLGDERGKEWTAIKAGGLMTQPGGKTYIIENYINTARNGIAASSVDGDSTFWVEVINNVIINHNFNNKVGLGVYDSQKYYASTFTNNIFFNTQINAPNLDIATNNLVEHPLTYDAAFISTYMDDEGLYYLPIESSNWVPNFSRENENSLTSSTSSNVTNSPAAPSYTDISEPSEFIVIDESKLSKFSSQTKYGSAEAFSDTSLVITGNSWYKLPVQYDVKPNTTLSFDIKVIGDVEIAGIALEINNTQTESAIFRLAGSQKYGNDVSHLITGDSFTSVTLEVGKYGFEDIKYLVFILDNDIDEAKNNAEVYFENIRFHTSVYQAPNIVAHDQVLIGIGKSD
ncbi:hypothetical protein A6F57_17665 [Alteromonas stellipolaris]|uniref:right-handed parallel beta-helix repeat-containing protein n=1 Tax=Alteromonas TaxID=226 RepID=UPI0007B424CE|nr:right-handed parallel beta-helix repeat-containing protein [Alteromonas stellipolaris]ANB26844.1 hypothetical protein A6F57_17665 [Alteromonas stellipolaris]